MQNTDFCPYEKSCGFGEICEEKCPQVVEPKDAIEFQGKLFYYKNDAMFVLKKGFYTVKIDGENKWFPYDSTIIYATGTATKDIWNLITYLKNKNEEDDSARDLYDKQ